jgi:hypothetical protein
MKPSIINDEVKGPGFAVFQMEFEPSDVKIPVKGEKFDLDIESFPSHSHLQKPQSPIRWVKGSTKCYLSFKQNYDGSTLKIALGPYVTDSFKENLHSFTLKGDQNTFDGIRLSTKHIKRPPQGVKDFDLPVDNLSGVVNDQELAPPPPVPPEPEPIPAPEPIPEPVSEPITGQDLENTSYPSTLDPNQYQYQDQYQYQNQVQYSDPNQYFDPNQYPSQYPEPLYPVAPAEYDNQVPPSVTTVNEKKSRTGLVLGLIGGLLCLLLVAAAIWYFGFRDKAQPDVAQDETSAFDPQSDNSQTTPLEPSSNSPDLGSLNYSVTPMQEAQQLVRDGAGRADLEKAFHRYEKDPQAQEAVFLLAKALTKFDNNYHVRLGRFYDPLDTDFSQMDLKNAKYAYDEYLAAGSNSEAKSRIDALKAWLNQPESAGIEGADELRLALNM